MQRLDRLQRTRTLSEEALASSTSDHKLPRAASEPTPEAKAQAKSDAKPRLRWKLPSIRIRVIVLLGIGILGVGAWLLLTGRVGRHHPPSTLVTLYGNVDIRQVELGFRVAGRIKTMALEEGQTVRAGTLMATLDARAFGDDVHLAEAEVAAQDANVRKLLAGSRPAEIARASATVDEAAAAAQNGHLSLERDKRLLHESAIPRSALDDVLAASRMADARRASARDSLRLLREGSRSEDIAAGVANLHVAQARLSAAQTTLDDTRLVAPSDGVVISRVHEVGAIVSPNDIVYVLSLTRSVWVRAYVAETQLGKLRQGMDVAVFSDASPQHPSHGNVGFISPTAEFTPKSVETPELRTDLVYRLRVIVDDPDPGLRQGMPVTVQIQTAGAGP
jgi:HlyD family secretion protein